MTRFIGSKFKYTLGAVVFLSLSNIGGASQLCSSLTQTLTGYAGQTCSVGNVLFTFPTLANGLYTFTNDSNNPPVPASDVSVAIVGSGTSPGTPVGFTFSATVPGWIATNPDGSIGGDSNNEADISLNLGASVTAPLSLVSTTLTIAPSLTYTGCVGPIAGCSNYNGGDFIGAGETAIDPNAPPNNDTLGGISLTIIGNSSGESEANGGTALSGTDSFPYPASSVAVDKDVLIAAMDTDSSVQVDSITETFNYTNLPEPGPFLATGAGLGLLFLLRRRKAALGIFGALVLIAVSSNSAHANAIQCATINGETLQQFETAGDCTIGDVLFTFDSSSLVINSASGNFREPSASGITITQEGLGFQFNLNNPVPQTLGTGELSFTVSFTAESTGNINGLFASDTITQNGDGTFASGSTCPSTQSCSQLLEGATQLAFVDFPAQAGGGSQDPVVPPVDPDTTLMVSTTFDMNSSGGPASSNYTHLSIFDAGVNEVPEPFSLVLLGSGLIAMGLFKRRSTPFNT